MTTGPGFDPYLELGVGLDADVVVIQLAYKAQVRAAHPDIAGAAGLERTKRLNIARDWLLDPARRASLARQPGTPNRADPATRQSSDRRMPRAAPRRAASFRPSGRTTFDPFNHDFGPRSRELHALLRVAASLSAIDRARLNYSLGDSRPINFDDYREFMEPSLWARSQALREAVSVVWSQGTDEPAPDVFPLGRLVPSGFLTANAYAQWILLGEFFRQELGDDVFLSGHVVDAFARRCIEPWRAAIGQPRYGPHEASVIAMLEAAEVFPDDAATRLARSWKRHLGRDAQGEPSDHIGPGVWLPAPPDLPEVLKVSGYLAAVDASRIEAPSGLADEDQHAWRFALRLTAHVLALGVVGGPRHDFLRPWLDAVEPERQLWGRMRGWLPLGAKG